MAQRLRFSIAQPVTIIGFVLASSLLIADTAALQSSGIHGFEPGDDLEGLQLALTSAFYYAIVAAAIYMMIAILLCLTVYGIAKGCFEKEFHLSTAQRTLMLQTMAFVSYLLIGALIFSRIEHWEYLDAVYWADVTLLTVGFGDYAPTTAVGRGLLFPFAIGGVLILGLVGSGVVGSIRVLVLDRGRETLTARLTERRRLAAVKDVDQRKQTIKISLLTKADFSTDPRLSPAQRREEEFVIMRKVQSAADRERRWFSLLTSIAFALFLWFGGAGIFLACEHAQGWSYFDALYFAFVSLMTIGYGDLTPQSGAGLAVYVFWSLLAVPSLTILISNMGDTIVKEVSHLTTRLASGSLLPRERGFRTSLHKILSHILEGTQKALRSFVPPGILGMVPDGHTIAHAEREDSDRHRLHMMDRIAQRLEEHIEQEELRLAAEAEVHGDFLERDLHFYHYVLIRECAKMQHDVGLSPPKQYSWLEWEYYLRLIGGGNDSLVTSTETVTTNRSQPIPESNAEHLPYTDSNIDRESELRGLKTGPLKRHRLGRHPENEDLRYNWSWLSEESPLLSSKPESQWILEQLSATLELSLNRQRKNLTRRPPISVRDAVRSRFIHEEAG